MLEIKDESTGIIYTFRESLTAREFRAIKTPMTKESKNYTPEAWLIDNQRYQDQLTVALSLKPKLSKDTLLDLDVMFLATLQLEVAGKFTAGFQKAIDMKKTTS